MWCAWHLARSWSFVIRMIRSAGIDRFDQDSLQFRPCDRLGEAFPCTRMNSFNPEIHLGLGDQQHNLGLGMTFLKARKGIQKPLERSRDVEQHDVCIRKVGKFLALPSCRLFKTEVIGFTCKEPGELVLKK